MMFVLFCLFSFRVAPFDLYLTFRVDPVFKFLELFIGSYEVTMSPLMSDNTQSFFNGQKPHTWGAYTDYTQFFCLDPHSFWITGKYIQS